MSIQYDTDNIDTPPIYNLT